LRRARFGAICGRSGGRIGRSELRANSGQSDNSEDEKPDLGKKCHERHYGIAGGERACSLVLGFYFGLAALVVLGLILSIFAAAILQNEDFDFLAGIAIIVLCLTVNQIAYLIGATRATRGPEDK
jgi:uncharacterized membrane protein